MSRFTKSLSLFIAGATLTNIESQAAQHNAESPFILKFDPTSLRPLNLPGDNLYAAHRSHSSHSSHSSHRSSSSSYSTPKRSHSAPTPPSPKRYNTPSGSSQPVDPGRPATVSPSGQDFDPKEANLLDLISRVQLALIIKGYSPGTVDGLMGPQTRNALKQFQKDQGLKIDGLMGTETLNALGVATQR
nr:His-Xaa-Ser repeat protein HxsA [uncultured Halomonas sp.]